MIACVVEARQKRTCLVYFNGELRNDAILADEEAGCIYVYAFESSGQLVLSEFQREDGEIDFEAVFARLDGHVEIRRT